MEALGINLGMLIIQIFAFVIVLLTLNAWVYKPMLNMMETRKQKIAQGLEDARVAAEARADAQKDADKILSEAQAEAAKIVREATERAAAAGQDVKTAAEVEAAKTREAAMAEAQMERNRVLGDLRGQVASLAIAAANKLVGETLDEKKQHALLDEFFSGVKSGKVVVLEDASGQAECLVFSELYAGRRGILTAESFVWAKARVSRREGDVPKLVAGEVLSFDEARTRAIAVARARADLYARALGTRVRRVIAVSEMGQPGIIMGEARGMVANMDAAATQIVPGEQVVGTSVTVTFELDPPPSR